jgi:amphi-Trp domain-containing protein
MGKEQREFEHESLQNQRTIVAYLEALKQGFASGKLSFRDPEGEIDLKPHGLVRFTVHADHKRDHARLTLRFDWRNGIEDGSRSWPLVVKGDRDAE